MPDFHTTHAQDNPPEKQAQREKNDADKRALDAEREGQASRRTTQEERDWQSKQANGPSGLNRGPSDTVSRDPHNPHGNPQGTSGGTGLSPPQRLPGDGKPGSDLDRRAELAGTDEAKRLAAEGQHDRDEADRKLEQARADRRDAEGKLAEQDRERGAGSGR